jgi:subtilase family serine protease
MRNGPLRTIFVVNTHQRQWREKEIRMDKPRYVSFEVVVEPGPDGKSVFDDDAFPTVENMRRFRPPHDKSVETARKLTRRGVTVHHIGDFSISASCTTSRFEKLFGTEVTAQKPPTKAKVPAGAMYFAPKKGAPWKLPTKDGLDSLIDRAYIQHDPILFAGERAIPPFWNDKFRLRVPVDVAQIMQASSVHRLGVTGDRVRVAMPDTGFYHHPYFQEQDYNFLAVAAPDVTNHRTDSHGHGTGECANLLATAPGINFIGVKMNNTVLGFKTAVDLRPDVITCSWGYSVDLPSTSMPNWLKPLHLAVLDAVARGITVCFSAGNGHYGFPGSMPEVISVGGVVVNNNLDYSATKYASGFDSTWFPGRQTPDICGLVGTPPSADYIVLPVQKGATLDKQGGWGAFSGTSAASPMVAGVCALLKEADPDLQPAEIKDILKYTARDITTGTNAHGKKAKPGPDGATGYGLVDAARAVDVVL